MTQAEKKICDSVFNEGKVLSLDDAKSVEGEALTFYRVLLDGETYVMTMRWNDDDTGEWIYFLREIEKGA